VLLPENSPLILLPHFVDDAGWKRLKANMIACPAWMLDGRPFAAANGAATNLSQFRCPLLGVKRTLIGHGLMSAFDPKRTLGAGRLRVTNDAILDPKM